MTTRTLAAFLLAPLLFAAASANSAGPGGERCTPHFEKGWIRLGPAAMPMMAGFGRLENRCARPISVVAASSKAFADVSMHRTRIESGVSRMRAVPSLHVAPGESAMFEPGGLHLMLMQPRDAISEGSTVRVMLRLANGHQFPADLIVRKSPPRAR